MGLKKLVGDVGTGSGKAYDGVRNSIRDFKPSENKDTLVRHFRDHNNGEFASKQEYLDAARNFLDKPPTSTTESFVTKDGTYFRYDTATNEFGIITKYGNISTYYKPTKGIDYWLGELKKYDIAEYNGSYKEDVQ